MGSMVLIYAQKRSIFIKRGGVLPFLLEGARTGKTPLKLHSTPFKP